MSFQISQGLFQLDFTDYHAILGVPIDAEFNELRKRYLKIARLLHPDTCKAATDNDKDLANQFLAKLVSPAYDKFVKEGERAEYAVLLGMMGKRCIQEPGKVKLQTSLAKQLSVANDYEKTYKTLVGNLAQNQYTNLSKTLEIIGEISELNVVYLMRKEGKAAGVTPSQPAKSASPTAAATTPTPAAAPPPPPAKPLSQVESSLRRAQEWMGKNNLDQAILELKDALKIEPKNSLCHALLGTVYLKKNQLPMARVHINKALELNPKEQIALDTKKQLDKPASKAGTKAEPAKGTPPKAGGKPEQPGGGIFGGLFGGGGKKK